MQVQPLHQERLLRAEHPPEQRRCHKKFRGCSQLLEKKTPIRPGPAHTASPRYTPCSADNRQLSCDLRDQSDWSKSSH
ncbi:hypothetical protein NQZ68_033370, partial [Dissostichus eleginoides]